MDSIHADGGLLGPLLVVLVVIGIGFLLYSRWRELRGPARSGEPATTGTHATEHAPAGQQPPNETHEVTQEHGHHGSSRVGTFVTVAMYVALTLGAYWLYTGMTSSPASRSVSREVHQCSSPSKDAVTIAKSESFSDPIQVPVGHILCTDPATDSGKMDFLCHHPSGWDGNCSTYDAVKIRSRVDGKAWTELM